jgi:oxygen-dependent protoporphyrinogen oxidase
VREFVEELGLTRELIEPQAKEFSILFGGALHRVPRGLTNLRAPTAAAIDEAGFLSDEAKARARDPSPVEVSGDISVRSFFSKRFGEEFCRLIAEPLLAGTHGGDPERLSMQALYPKFLSTENAHSESPEGPTFLSFRDGMRTLPWALLELLERTRVMVGQHLVRLPSADRILLAIPAPAAATFFDEPLAGLLRSIPHRNATIVTDAYPDLDIEMEGTGFLVPEGEHDTLTGASWSSAKWEGRGGRHGALARYFIRPDRTPEDLRREDFPWLEPNAQLLFSNSVEWPIALPQYELGHLDLLSDIDAALSDFPDVFLAGTSYRGVGIPDCVRQGREAARKIAETL